MLFSLVGCYTWRVAKRPADQQEAMATEQPTEIAVDTEAPTEEPSAAPTEEATPAPTEEAAPEPTEEVTPEPTEEATPAPTGSETDKPTAAPSGTPEPTATPKPSDTPKPTATPTPAPTATPKPTATPSPEPDLVFTGTDIRNGKVYTESIFSKSKLTMLNIWATWCGPCIEELPLMPQIESHFSGKLKIYTILYFREGEGGSDIPQGITIANNIPDFSLPVIGFDYFKNKPDSMYNAFIQFLSPATLPTTVFVNKSGKVVKVIKGRHDFEQWCAEIEKML